MHENTKVGGGGVYTEMDAYLGQYSNHELSYTHVEQENVCSFYIYIRTELEEEAHLYRAVLAKFACWRI